MTRGEEYARGCICIERHCSGRAAQGCRVRRVRRVPQSGHAPINWAVPGIGHRLLVVEGPDLSPSLGTRVSFNNHSSFSWNLDSAFRIFSPSPLPTFITPLINASEIASFYLLSATRSHIAPACRLPQHQEEKVLKNNADWQKVANKELKHLHNSTLSTFSRFNKSDKASCSRFITVEIGDVGVRSHR